MLTTFVSFLKELGEQLCVSERVVPELLLFLCFAIVVAGDGRMSTVADWAVWNNNVLPRFLKCERVWYVVMMICDGGLCSYTPKSRL